MVMDKSTLRIISKAGFLLIVIGIFLPFVLNQNGFKVVNYLSDFFSENTEYFSNFSEEETENFSIFKSGKNTFNISLYGIFIVSCIGVALFILLLIKKFKYSIIFDWALIIVSIIAMLGIFSGISNVLRYIPIMPDEINLFGITGVGKKVGYIGDIIFPLLKSGAYFIIAGVIISIIFNLTASFANVKNNKIVYDIKLILILLFVIFSLIFGCFLAILTG